MPFLELHAAWPLPIADQASRRRDRSNRVQEDRQLSWDARPRRATSRVVVHEFALAGGDPDRDDREIQVCTNDGSGVAELADPAARNTDAQVMRSARNTARRTSRTTSARTPDGE
jgi:hypothetical protein